MPTLDFTTFIDAPIKKVLDIVKNTEAYPEFTPDVKSVKILERSEDGNRQVVEWVGTVKQFGLTVKWIQEDIWEGNRVTFKQISGDYDSMSGWWEFKEEPNGTEFASHMEYEYNVPLVGPLVKKVVSYIVKQNVESMIDAIRRRAEQSN
jgi:ribosome-associated toxin RatA of RatAB toxin-antitoxin module